MGVTHSVNLDNHKSFVSVDVKVTTTLVVGQPITNDLSAECVASETSSKQLDNHISHTRTLFFNLKVVLDLQKTKHRVIHTYQMGQFFLIIIRK